MKQIIIGTKNQIVIPREVRRKVTGLSPGKTVSIYLVNGDTVVIKASQASWLERGYGKTKEASKNSNSLKQVEEMRDEWDEK